MNYTIETTDTFGGQANYCWCDRYELTIADDATDRQLVTAFKAAAGLTGMKGRSSWIGDVWEFRPYGMNQVTFAIPEY